LSLLAVADDRETGVVVAGGELQLEILAHCRCSSMVELAVACRNATGGVNLGHRL
jgi:hypothetical protein